jgi:hypothetical protein
VKSKDVEQSKPTDLVQAVAVEGVGEKKRFFSGLHLFKGIDKDRLFFFSTAAFKKKFSPSQTLIEQGEESDSIYFVSKGIVSLYRSCATFVDPAERQLGLISETAMQPFHHNTALQMFQTM